LLEYQELSKYFVVTLVSSFLLLGYYLTIIYLYGWHEHLGIGDLRALAIYKTNPNDTAITNWENSVQSKIDILNVECVDFSPALYCYDLTIEVQKDCLPHTYMPLCKDYLIGQFTDSNK